MRRGILYPLTLFGSQMFYMHWLVVWELGYPVVTATVTNDYWEMVRINMEILGVVLLLFIPTLVLAALTTMLVALCLAAARISFRFALHGSIFGDGGE